MKAICNYLLNDPMVHAILDVKEMNLEEVGDMIVEGGPVSNAEEKFKDLVLQEKVIFYYSVEDVRIPLTNAIGCIRLYPFYLVKDLKKKFQ